MKRPGIYIEQYDYPLPEGRIARYPLAERDASKLLLYQNGRISQDVFRHIPAILPEGSLLVFNETKVIQARLKFRKESGARIEIFCLEPVNPVTDFQMAFQMKEKVAWKCFVGNSKKWKEGRLKMDMIINESAITLEAQRLEHGDEYQLIEFKWSNECSFGEILESAGHTPIPPYLKRESELSDKERYQTLYAKYEGSVAAPTAGLHFTERVIRDYKRKGIEEARLNLHVGAGTFKPVVHCDVHNHVMHHERIMITRKHLKKILKHMPCKVVAVGTTSVRTMESLYWHGIKVLEGMDIKEDISIDQWEPYLKEMNEMPDPRKVLGNLLDRMGSSSVDVLQGSTQLMILPGYTYRIVSGLITNFHQPRSTLLLLVSAFIGQDWRKVYDYALKNDFRFLSYGDSCLFLP